MCRRLEKYNCFRHCYRRHHRQSSISSQYHINTTNLITSTQHNTLYTPYHITSHHTTHYTHITSHQRHMKHITYHHKHLILNSSSSPPIPSLLLLLLLLLLKLLISSLFSYLVENSIFWDINQWVTVSRT